MADPDDQQPPEDEPSYRVYRAGEEEFTEERPAPEGRDAGGPADDEPAEADEDDAEELDEPGEDDAEEVDEPGEDDSEEVPDPDPAPEPDPGPVEPSEPVEPVPSRTGKPEYKVYRSRRKLGSRPGLEGLRRSGADGGGGGFRDRFRGLGAGGGWRRWLKWALIAAFAWILISFISFGISAQIQKGKLSDEAKAALADGPPVLAGSNILILGGDQRGEVGANESGGGGTPHSDTIMVVHASLTSFRKLSIPRDTLAAVPGCGSQKINAAFACNGGQNGNAALAIKTIENFLGIDINHLVIVDFDGFVDFIDALGGVEVDLPNKVCGTIGGGKKNGGQGIRLEKGEHTLRALQALALARIRKNECDPSEDDRDRAARQQLILQGVKSRLTSPTRFPINFLKGPLIGWAAPKAFISDMGGIALPQVAIAAIFGGGGDPNVLEPSASVGGNLIISGSECERAVEELTGSKPDRDPACSPAG